MVGRTGGRMMPVRKRKFKNGEKWCVDVMLPNGRRYRKVIGTKKQAEKVQKKIEAEIVEGKWDVRDAEDITFSQLAGKYVGYTTANKAKSTSTGDKIRIEANLKPYFGNKSLSQITPQMVDNYKIMRSSDGISPRSSNQELMLLSHMFRMAIRWRYTDRNVISNVDKMKVPEKPHRFLSQEEIERLVEAAKESYIHPLIVTVLHTGMRRSELFNLKWSDIDFDQKTVTVQAKEDWHTKNYKSRTIQLTPALEKVLREQRKSQSELGVRSEYVFTYQGRRIVADISKSLKKVLKRAKIENVTLHTLRHTFASQLAMAGVSLMDVKELMGHQNYATTLQYAHLAKDHVKKQVLKLPYANG
jgi:integrase